MRAVGKAPPKKTKKKESARAKGCLQAIMMPIIMPRSSRNSRLPRLITSECRAQPNPNQNKRRGTNSPSDRHTAPCRRVIFRFGAMWCIFISCLFFFSSFFFFLLGDGDGDFTAHVKVIVAVVVGFSRTGEGGALPVIMSIIGPRETHDYHELHL